MKEAKKMFARRLRKEQTKAEEKTWELLRDRAFMGLKFRRQHVIEGFVLDFYCLEHKLGIEIDGGIHLSRKDYDDLRQGIIESKGVKIIRLTNEEVLKNKRSLYRKIKEVIEPPNDPSPFRRGGKPIRYRSTIVG